jgi:hypothetical protein
MGAFSVNSTVKGSDQKLGVRAFRGGRPSSPLSLTDTFWGLTKSRTPRTKRHLQS